MNTVSAILQVLKAVVPRSHSAAGSTCANPIEQAQYQAIVNTAIDGIVVIDDAGIVQSFNPAAVRIFGYRPDEVIGRNVNMLMPQPHRDAHDGYMRNYRMSRVAKIIGIGREVEGCRKDGTLIPVDLAIAEWTSGGRQYFTGIMRDLTDRKQSERSTRDLLNALHLTSVIICDMEGRILFWTDGCERLYGWTADEVTGLNKQDVVRTEFPEAIETVDATLLRDGEWRGDVREKRKDGREITVASHWLLRRGGNGEPIAVVQNVSDVTMLRRTQRDLHKLNKQLEQRVQDEIAEREAAQMRAAQAERMQALGQLAGGIAHDFNNVLQAVSSSATLLAMRATDPDHVRRIATTIGSAADRGASVTERLLAFARRSTLKADMLDVEKILTDLSKLLAQTLGMAISVRVETEAGLPLMLADKGQLETVLVNLATNARDAMTDGGTLRFSASRLAIGKNDSEWGDQSPGLYIRLTVTDSGTGMDTATLARATEPFFTTKPQGKGTGLGLSMAKGFAEQSGGAIRIESTPDTGTTVVLIFPQADGHLAEDHGAAQPYAQQEGTARPHILFVDDDPLIRDTVGMQLESAGYAVNLAANAMEAIAVFTPANTDLLVTDLSMPGADGVTLIHDLREQKPDLPAILMTGYAMGYESKLRDGGMFRILHKPVSAARLNAEVAASLASRRDDQPPSAPAGPPRPRV